MSHSEKQAVLSDTLTRFELPFQLLYRSEKLSRLTKLALHGKANNLAPDPVRIIVNEIEPDAPKDSWYGWAFGISSEDADDGRCLSIDLREETPDILVRQIRVYSDQLKELANSIEKMDW
jgi:hypothetical protein